MIKYQLKKSVNMSNNWNGLHCWTSDWNEWQIDSHIFDIHFHLVRSLVRQNRTFRLVYIDNVAFTPFTFCCNFFHFYRNWFSFRFVFRFFFICIHSHFYGTWTLLTGTYRLVSTCFNYNIDKDMMAGGKTNATKATAMRIKKRCPYLAHLLQFILLLFSSSSFVFCVLLVFFFQLLLFFLFLAHITC